MNSASVLRRTTVPSDASFAKDSFDVITLHRDVKSSCHDLSDARTALERMRPVWRPSQRGDKAMQVVGMVGTLHRTGAPACNAEGSDIEVGSAKKVTSGMY